MMQTDELQSDSIACRSVVAELLAIVAEAYELQPDDIWRDGRGCGSISEARGLFVWLATKDPRCRLSGVELGRAVGGRDHTTIISARKRHVANMETDEWLARRSNELLANVLEKSRGNQE